MEAPTVNWYRKRWTAAELREKAEAYRILYDREPIIEIDGAWYGPFRGKPYPAYSIHGTYQVRSIGTKYVEIRGREGTDHVLPTEPWGTNDFNRGVIRVTFKPGVPATD